MAEMTICAAINRGLMGLAFLPGLGYPLMASQAEGRIWFDQVIGRV